MQETTATQIITARLLTGAERLQALPRFFGKKMLRAENLVYAWMGSLCPGYCGGYWDYLELSNGGFVMRLAATGGQLVRVESNGYEGKMSTEAASLVAMLFALCQLANETEADEFIDLYHFVRDYALEHAEAKAIFAAID